jgi:hypothetical protein
VATGGGSARFSSFMLRLQAVEAIRLISNDVSEHLRLTVSDCFGRTRKGPLVLR